ncbi:hypothetical protein H696_03527 [Fonticula alba]|uniref:SH3 domain-containing protein n=1 Tax=Fonticula alba TaxID=691883 RepID=A0A058Z706_FONAL|nr:hypothetical protein H696_03527 [Fonticula alba]KCV70064.1 hypothetical protein H696_03527 [Fonticula alba]|eukprot:XP_009495670.1 hypothetical protein H696_03527 [Fonticula alba]
MSMTSVALYDLEQVNKGAGELPFRQGDVFTDVEVSSDGWLLVTHAASGERGYVPASYLEKPKPAAVAAAPATPPRPPIRPKPAGLTPSVGRAASVHRPMSMYAPSTSSSHSFSSAPSTAPVSTSTSTTSFASPPLPSRPVSQFGAPPPTAGGFAAPPPTASGFGTPPALPARSQTAAPTLPQRPQSVYVGGSGPARDFGGAAAPALPARGGQGAPVAGFGGPPGLPPRTAAGGGGAPPALPARSQPGSPGAGSPPSLPARAPVVVPPYEVVSGWDIPDWEQRTAAGDFARRAARQGVKNSLGTVVLPGAAAAAAMSETVEGHASRSVLGDIWDLADIDRDGALDVYEFIVAIFLSRKARAGQPPPKTLSYNMTPPSKRR